MLPCCPACFVLSHWYCHYFVSWRIINKIVDKKYRLIHSPINSQYEQIAQKPYLYLVHFNSELVLPHLKLKLVTITLCSSLM